MRVDRLTISAVVSDRFTDTLTRLQDQLLDVAEAQTLVDENQTIDVNVRGLTELSALNTQLATLSTLDHDRDIDVGASAVHPAMHGAASAATSSVGDGGGVPTGDGGRTGGMPMSDAILKASERFGDAFDNSAIVDRPDRIHRATDLLDGDVSDFIDSEGVRNGLLDPSSPIDSSTLKSLKGLDADAFEAFDLLDEQGHSSLPTRRFRPLKRLAPNIADRWSAINETFENFDATTINNLYASFVPLIAVFVGALPAAIAGLGALAAAALTLAGAFASIGALGALGVVVQEGNSLSKVAEDLRESFVEAFSPIAEALRPTFLAAVDSIEVFFDELGSRAGVLRRMSDLFLTVLDAIEGMVLGAFEDLVAFARLAAPLFAAIFDRIGDIDFVGILAGVLADTVPMLLRLGGAIVALLPTIYELSRGFLIATTGIIGFFVLMGRLIDVIPGSIELFGVLIATLLTLVTVFSIAIAFQKLWAASLTQSVVAAIGSAITALQVHIATLWTDAVATMGATWATIAFGTALLGVIGIVTLGIGAVAGLGSSFSILGGDIKKATDRLKQFSKQRGKMSGGFGSPTGGTGGSPYVNYTDNSQTTIEAPDVETGTTVSKKHRYDQRKAEQFTT